MNRKKIRTIITVGSVLLFVGCVSFLIYYLVLQPYHSRKVTQKYREIYYDSDSNNNIEKITGRNKFNNKLEVKLDKSKKGEKNSNNVLVKFEKLLYYNSDIKGWLNIPGTNIDYPVMQAYNGSDFYLRKDFEGNRDKNGCLYIDKNCNVKKPSKNIVIHGHNMDSTGMMFHQLLKYKDINFYKEHPIITFDSLYEEAKWKVIAYIRVSGDMKNNPGFNYLQGNFKSKKEFINFIYQAESRSLYYCPVSVNEKDQLLMLSTCSYEVNNYRTVVVARKLRKGESSKVDTTKAYMRNDQVLYPESYYHKYGGKAPQIISFAESMGFETPQWYDGKYKYDSIINRTFTVGKAIYKILSKEEVEFVGYSDAKIKDLTIPSTIIINERKYDVTSIDKYAFGNAIYLKTIKIGNKIKTIPKKLFANCPKLTSVIIGESVMKIESKAFYKLDSLKKIKLKCTDLETIEPDAYKGIFVRAKFKLPKNKAKQYTKLIKTSGAPNKAKYITYTDK